MADLTDLQAAQSVKIVGSDNTGVEQTPVQSTANGSLQVNLRDNAGTELGTAANPLYAVANTVPTYSAAITGLVAAATPTDIFTITGSATKTIRISLISISGTASLTAVKETLLIKRSTANSGGTSTTPSAVPHDSTNAAGTAVVRAYTVNPTLGTAIGTIRTAKFILQSASTSTAMDYKTFEFGNKPLQAVVLRGTTEVLALNLNLITSAGNSLNIYIEWTEE